MKLHTSFDTTLSNPVIEKLMNMTTGDSSELIITPDQLGEETLLAQLLVKDLPSVGISNSFIHFTRYDEVYRGMVSNTDRGNFSAYIVETVVNDEGEEDVIIHILHDGTRGRFVEFLFENGLYTEEFCHLINDPEDHFVYVSSEPEMLATETMTTFLERTRSKKKAYQILAKHAEKYPHDFIREVEGELVFDGMVKAAVDILKGTSLYEELTNYAKALAALQTSLYFIRTNGATSRFD